MEEDEVRELLNGAIAHNGLYSLGWYLGWSYGDDEATLDGEFTADDLEAIAWWMRNTKGGM